MKRAVAAMLVATMVLGLTACGSSGGGSASGSASAGNGGSEVTASGEASVTDTSALADLSLLASNADEDPVYGGKMTILYGDDLIQYFDPAMGDNRTYGIYLETLFANNWESKDAEAASSNYVNYKNYAGQIADSYEVDYDAETVTVTIRDDVFFQDKAAAVPELAEYDIFGARQLTASDVAYSYQRLLGIDGVEATTNTEFPWEVMLPPIETIEVVDDYTVVFHMPGITEVQLDAFITTPVSITGPEWDELTSEEQSDWHYAIGTGPYILTGFELNASMTYVKSDNYYDYDERHPENKLPYFDEVEFVEIADSANILTQFISGQIDVISFGNDLLSTSEMENLRDTLGEGNYIEVDYWNAPVGIANHMNIEDSPMSNEAVRRAMQHAIDWKTITKAVYGVEDPELWGFWAAQTGWQSEIMQEEIDAGAFDYDPELARQELADAGYADGFEFTLYSKNQSDFSTIYQMTKQYLAQVGITMNIEMVTDTAELNQHATNSEEDCVVGVTAGQFALKFATMSLPGGPAYSLFTPNEVFDDLAAKLSTATSLDEQKETAQALDDIFVGEHYGVYLTGCTLNHEFYSGKMGGVTGERFASNINTKIMVSRLFSKTGE